MSAVRMPGAPRFVAPVGACDSHSHVFAARAATVDAPSYALPDAPYARHRAMLDTLGMMRGVLVQPSAYAGDHGALIDAIARSDGRLRGVGLLGEAASDAALDRLDAAGVRALRFVEMRVAATGQRYAGSIGIAQLDALRARLTARGWHAEVWASLADAAAICNTHAGRGVPLVLDHMAGATTTTDPDDPDFRTILRHLARGDIWVKLVLCRTAQRVEDTAPVQRLHAALIAANPDRLLWGSDFPFIGKGSDAPDAGALLDRFADWTPDAGTRRAILVDNPATLYRFEEGPA